jgi:hypothetical protein
VLRVAPYSNIRAAVAAPGIGIHTPNYAARPPRSSRGASGLGRRYSGEQVRANPLAN